LEDEVITVENSEDDDAVAVVVLEESDEVCIHI
jgi:hypothetical protein